MKAVLGWKLGVLLASGSAQISVAAANESLRCPNFSGKYISEVNCARGGRRALDMNETANSFDTQSWLSLPAGPFKVKQVGCETITFESTTPESPRPTEKTEQFERIFLSDRMITTLRLTPRRKSFEVEYDATSISVASSEPSEIYVPWVTPIEARSLLINRFKIQRISPERLRISSFRHNRSEKPWIVSEDPLTWVCEFERISTPPAAPSKSGDTASSAAHQRAGGDPA